MMKVTTYCKYIGNNTGNIMTSELKNQYFEVTSIESDQIFIIRPGRVEPYGVFTCNVELIEDAELDYAT